MSTTRSNCSVASYDAVCSYSGMPYDMISCYVDSGSSNAVPQVTRVHSALYSCVLSYIVAVN
eukprot:15398-Heterococcus_DN1.PRE.1